MSDKAPEKELQDLGWCIVEVMGHRRLGGQVREVALAGTVLLRVDVPAQPGAVGEQDRPGMTQLYGGGAIYCITPTTEAAARFVAARWAEPPVQRYELPRSTASTVEEPPFDDVDPLEASELEERA